MGKKNRRYYPNSPRALTGSLARSILRHLETGHQTASRLQPTLATQGDGRKVFLATGCDRGPHRRLWFDGFSHFFPNAVGACGWACFPRSARFDGHTSASRLTRSSHCFLGLHPCLDSLQDLPEREDIIESGCLPRILYSHVLMITFVAFTVV